MVEELISGKEYYSAELDANVKFRDTVSSGETGLPYDVALVVPINGNDIEEVNASKLYEI